MCESQPAVHLLNTRKMFFFTVMPLDAYCFLDGSNHSATLTLHDSCQLTITWTDQRTFSVEVNRHSGKPITASHVSNFNVELKGNVNDTTRQNLNNTCALNFKAMDEHYDAHLSMVRKNFGENRGGNSSCSITIAFNKNACKLMRDVPLMRNDWWHVLVIMFGCAVGVCLAITVSAICVYRRLIHLASVNTRKINTMEMSTLKTSSVAELSSRANNKDNKSPEKQNHRKESLNGPRNRPPMISMHAIQANFGAGAGSTTPQDSNSQLSPQYYKSDYSRK